MVKAGKQLEQHATFVHAELSIYANSLFLGVFLPLEKSTKFTSPV